MQDNKMQNIQLRVNSDMYPRSLNLTPTKDLDKLSSIWPKDPPKRDVHIYLAYKYLR